MARRNAMLVLTRKIGERIVIGDSIVVTVLETAKNKVRIGISAPDEIPILREEISFATASSKERTRSRQCLARTKTPWAERSELFFG
jgi:carbon storage regulator